MGNLNEANPFNRVRKVIKTTAERRARSPIRLQVGAQPNKAPQNDETNRQMKEVTNFWCNAYDTMGYDWRYWLLPWAPQRDHPGCDGVNWHVRACATQ